MSKRAILYARVSGDDRGNESRNLNGQLDMCREYAQEKGYQIIAELPEDDKGASGYNIDLPKLDQIREMAKAKEFDVLVVRELDRLSRNLAKQLIVEQELNRAGVVVEYVLTEYDDTPEGRLQKHLRATIAEFEREKINERMTRGKRLAAKAKKVLAAGKPPYGYKVSMRDDKSTLEPDEEEAQVVKMLFDWYFEGKTLYWIRKELKRLNIPTWGDKRENGQKITNREREKCEWANAVLHRMFKNETYIGTWHYGKANGRKKKRNGRDNWIAIDVPAIVSREVWNVVQTKLTNNKQAPGRVAKHEYLLGGHVICGCGYKMRGIQHTSIKGGREYTYKYYLCPAQRPGYYVRSCTMLRFRADGVDAVVWEWIKAILLDTEKLEEGLREYQANREKFDKPVIEKLEVIDSLLADNRSQHAKLLDLYLSGDFPKEMLVERKKRFEDTIASLEKERAGLVARLQTKLTPDHVQSIKEYAAKVGKGLAKADENFAKRREVIEMLEVKVTLRIEEGRRVADVECVLGKEILLISRATMIGGSPRLSGPKF